MAVTALAGQQWQQRKDAGIGGRAERQWRQRMSAPSEAADDMTEASDSGEACVQYCATTCVIDEIKAVPAGAPGHIGIDRLAPVVDRHRADRAHIVGIGSGTGGEDLGAVSLG